MASFSGKTILDGTTLKPGNSENFRGFPVLLRKIKGPFTIRAPYADPVDYDPQAHFEKRGLASRELVVPVSVSSTLLAGGL